MVVAVDPWIGDRNDEKYLAFVARMSRLNDIAAERMTIGDAMRNWSHGAVCVAFVDAAHDYVIVAHDVSAIQRIIGKEGYIAFHDTDNIAFADCRRAIFEEMERFELVAHIPKLVIAKTKG